MSETLIKVPIEIDGWDISFSPENQTISLLKKTPDKFQLKDTNFKSNRTKNSQIEVLPQISLEVDLIERLWRWLKSV